ncbi:type IV pilus modification PilV family protein [Aeoliella mucimassa]|uniref:Prepilin-type N-terminal cleavage/methylation domain-containing protein n=1 Tax=Aeoliella mucimassa TaxID=2527972 RepID=A0A518AU68_9BACT|nr:prepilin-type N-terminal cleavage/methylation domain-containing protein [Aeoliella mucimassa]QDU58267.1 hypothetical protein Pan181_45000 [Aeoliella mucimassa]
MIQTYSTSMLHPRPSRAGVTLAEVLISMAILSIGLLGAAAMFPVGSYYMLKADIADNGAAIAQAAFAELVAKGQLSPENWSYYNGETSWSMGNSMRNWMATADRSNESVYQRNLNRDQGFVYVIDPLGTAAGIRDGLNTNGLLMAPYAADVSDPVSIAGGAGDRDRWKVFEDLWPVRRCSSLSTAINGVPNEAAASRMFKSGDDMNFVPSDEDGATVQRMLGDFNGDGIIDTNSGSEAPLARESKGNYSWIAMVAPTQSDAREALALNPSAYYYDVSVVVFYKRALGSLQLSERLVAGRVVSTGTGGGELLLTQLRSDAAQTTEPFAELKAGQWIMVSGPHPSSTPAEPLFFTQWYKVLAVDDTPTGNGFTDSNRQRLVGLRGPDWPWAAGAEIRVGLFPGAVAVHTKTMRIESLGEYQR